SQNQPTNIEISLIDNHTQRNRSYRSSSFRTVPHRLTSAYLGGPQAAGKTGRLDARCTVPRLHILKYTTALISTRRREDTVARAISKQSVKLSLACEPSSVFSKSPLSLTVITRVCLGSSCSTNGLAVLISPLCRPTVKRLGCDALTTW
uniref:Uncharacterized protein n=1 Tax=Salmo trutta TaxID=8032 RepID=A0A673VLG9_SALTR